MHRETTTDASEVEPAALRLTDSCAPIDADDTLRFAEGPWKRVTTQVVAVLAASVYAAYLVYRGLYTINPDAPGFSALVYAAELHGFFSLLFYFHQTWVLRTRTVVVPPPGRSVDVFITTYNEDLDLLRQTVRAALRMRYPHTTWVLDDGRRDDVRTMCEELGARYLRRDDNRHAKAGNWNHAFAKTSGELIATFDADHVPRADFLERTLGFFRDPKVALVQVPQQYHNLDSVQHRVNWKTRRAYGEQDVFFRLVMPGKDHWNAAFFCGTGAVLRREALAPHGGILTGTITEDLHTSIVLHADGWKSVYLNEVLVTGLAPMDLHSFAIQRLRWAEGNLQTAKHVNPVTSRGLTASQRVAYLASLYHWTIGFPKLIFYLAPPWILFTGHFPIANFDARFLALYLTFLGTLIGSYVIVSRGTGRLFMDELFNMASFFTLLRAAKRVVFGRGRPSTFQVTPKTGAGSGDQWEVAPHLVLLGFSMLAISWSLLGLGFGVSDDAFGSAVATFWTLYNMGLMVGVVRLATRPAQKRRSCRFRAAFPAEIRGRASGDNAIGITADISDRGCTLLWPVPLEKGARLPLRLHLGSRHADWTGEVVARHGERPDRWVVHGIRFVDIGQPDVDLLNDAIFNGVVPELFSSLSAASRTRRVGQALASWVTTRRGIRARRRPVQMPVRVEPGGTSFLATARDISATGLSLVATRPAAVGSHVELEILAPHQRWRGRLSVARCVAQPAGAGFEAWIWGLRFETAKDQDDIERFRQWNAA